MRREKRKWTLSEDYRNHDKQFASLVFRYVKIINNLRAKTYRNVTAGEEVKGDQPEVDVVHRPLEGSDVFGCNEVDRGRLQLQRQQFIFKDFNCFIKLTFFSVANTEQSICYIWFTKWWGTKFKEYNKTNNLQTLRESQSLCITFSCSYVYLILLGSSFGFILIT